MQKVNFEKELPEQILFSLTNLDDIGVLKRTTAKKFIADGLIISTRIGKKHYISRSEILRFLDENTNK